ncbi:hypothetical protein KIN20_031084 [Parelaphostrongylus tenuis]|uniref:Uncharacterized protein n=1 Tax=Parelaphostrongylus tenuis TaxID=148309 RepID=A0AAD5R4N7_PARTN|nr:hypothetical protein KIN20_031084 [Parelaphostrongylus tenuis]
MDGSETMRYRKPLAVACYNEPRSAHYVGINYGVVPLPPVTKSNTAYFDVLAGDVYVPIHGILSQQYVYEQYAVQNMTGLSTDLSIISLLTTILTVLGCGVVPEGKVFDVLELQARSALLSDAIISSILSQVTVDITYEPLQCQKVLHGPGR